MSLSQFNRNNDIIKKKKIIIIIIIIIIAPVVMSPLEGHTNIGLVPDAQLDHDPCWCTG